MAKRNGSYYIKAAENAGLKIKNGKGDHVKVYANGSLPANYRNPLPIPYDLKGNGTEHVIIKWLLAAGVVLTSIICAAGHLLGGL